MVGVVSIDPRVDIGHVHLKVADIDRALAFWRGVLGFDVMQRYGEQAAFISAGGYHHHIGLNTWESRGGSPPPPRDDRPLSRRRSATRTGATLGDALRRLVDAGWPIDGATDHGVTRRIYLHDPDGNGVELYRDRPRGGVAATESGDVAMTTPRSTCRRSWRRPADGEGIRRRPAAEEAERRREELERGGDAPREREQRPAVYGSTPDEPERHFIGWRDEVDPDELFASGRRGASPSSALRFRQ